MAARTNQGATALQVLFGYVVLGAVVGIWVGVNLIFLVLVPAPGFTDPIRYIGGVVGSIAGAAIGAVVWAIVTTATWLFYCWFFAQQRRRRRS